MSSKCPKCGKKISIDLLLDALLEADAAELIRVNAVTNQCYKDLQEREVRSYSVGDKVQFYSIKRGKTIKGTILKVLKRKVLIKTETDGEWKVSGTLLSKCK